MARKRITGRSRPSTPQGQLKRSVEKTNKKLNRLQKSGKLGEYSSKKLIRRIQGAAGISYRQNAKQKIRIDTVRLNVSQVRYYLKIFTDFNNTITSSPIGIANKEAKAREKLKESLSILRDKDIDDQDIEDFYTLVEDEDYRYFADKVGDSDMYILLEDAKTKELDEDGFIDLLKQYMTINTKEVRDKAKNLYNKFVKD